ncbi:MAG TPA: hypothetical protein VJM08_17130 [Anaerolineales bacterium]|nr:hypothetical protein [Anaerolineales bacterium]
MKITKEAAKAWKAEYDLMNEIEREEMKERLPAMTVEQSLKTYFELCRFMIAISGSSDEPHELHELRARDQAALIAKWKLLAERLGHVT